MAFSIMDAINKKPKAPWGSSPSPWYNQTQEAVQQAIPQQQNTAPAAPTNAGATGAWADKAKSFTDTGGSLDPAMQQAEWNKMFTQNPHQTPSGWGGVGYAGGPNQTWNSLDRGWSYSGPEFGGENTIGDPLGGISIWPGGDYTAQGGIGTYGWKPGQSDPYYGGVYNTRPDMPDWFPKMFKDYNRQPYEGGYTPGEETFTGKVMGERMQTLRQGPNSVPAGQSEPWKQAMKGGVLSANPMQDMLSSREDLARSAYGQLEQGNQMGQFADAKPPWMGEIQQPGLPGHGDLPVAQMPTPWGTHEAPGTRKMASMQMEADRIQGQSGFGEGSGGLSEFYNQFPWMQGDTWETENTNFNQMINPQGQYGEIPMGQPDPSYFTQGGVEGKQKII